MPPRRRALATSLSTSLLLHAFALVVVAQWTAAIDDATPMAIEFVEAAPTMPDEQLPTPDDTAGTGGFDPAPLQLGALQIDIHKVRARVGVLFPFLTLDLKFLERIPGDIAAAQESLVDPYGKGGTTSTTPPLEISDDELQATINGAWSRRERWATFATMRSLLEGSAADRGRAADLVRGYLDQNILQPYCDGVTRDPRYWAMMENAADHADFIDFVRAYARRYPSSPTTTELLFLLDELVQGSRDVLMMLIDTQPPEDLTLTRELAPDGYALAVEIKERYGRWLFDRGWNKGEVRRHYNDLRLRLLKTIVETTPRGHRRADAQFLAAQVLFEMNRVDDAVRIWRSIAPIPGDAYYRAYSEMLDVLGDGPPDLHAIRRVLSREYGRWRVFSIDRLREFGHNCETF